MATLDTATIREGNTVHTYLLPTANNMRQVAIGDRMLSNAVGRNCCGFVIILMAVIGTIGSILVASNGCFDPNPSGETRSFCDRNYDNTAKAALVGSAVIGDIGTGIACCVWCKKNF